MPGTIAQISKIFLSIVLFVFLSVILSSCRSQRYSNSQLYNSPGFDPGTMPNVPNQQMRVAPDYYYRQPAYPPAQPQYIAPSPAPSPYYGVAPGSRFYSNPYAIPPSTQYPYYDADQYYVPPTYYRNIEQDQRSPDQPQSNLGASQKY